MTLPMSVLVASVSILPILVFLAETCVVTLSTVRTIFVTRGMKKLAALLGFFEISIWLFAISQVMQHLNSPDCYIAFAAGFSLGNFLGVSIERKLALGTVAIRVTTRTDAGALIQGLRAEDCGVTALDAQGVACPMRIVSMTVRRKELDNVISIIRGVDPEAFYSVYDLNLAAEPRREIFADENSEAQEDGVLGGHQKSEHPMRSHQAGERVRAAA